MGNQENKDEMIQMDERGIHIASYNGYELISAFQPIYERSMDQKNKFDIFGYEGLVRIEKDEDKIEPCEFFSDILEDKKSNLDLILTELHIKNFLLLNQPDTKLFLNLNAANFESPDDMEANIYKILSMLAEHRLNQGQTVFEILETEVHQEGLLDELCNILSANKYQYALDDFGVDHSDVKRYLALNPDIVKIDQNLFQSCENNAQLQNLLYKLIQKMKKNNVKVLVEGVEKEEEFIALNQLGIDMAQGFYLGRPLPIDEILNKHHVRVKQVGNKAQTPPAKLKLVS